MHIEDEKLAAEIHKKLKSDPGATYSEIADKAFELGRKKLALNVRLRVIPCSAFALDCISFDLQLINLCFLCVVGTL